MKKNSITRSLAAVPVLFALFASNASAVLTTTINPFDNATVKPAGPRSGASGKNFFNVEGDGNGANASYGVLDFNASTFGLSAGSVGSVNGITLTLIESNAAFTAPGAFSFYLTTDTTTSIQPDNTSLTYVSPSASNNGGVGTNLSTMYLLGTGNFTTTGNVNTGTADVYTFTLSGMDPAAQTYLVNALNSGSTLRFVLTPNDTTLGATWSGFSGTAGAPQLQLDYSAVPEPGSLALLAVGAGFLFWRVRRVVKTT